MVRTNRRRASLLDISLAPFIDVIFLLLCFFVVTTRFDDVQKMAIDLPESTSETINKNVDFLEISLDLSGSLHIGNKQVNPTTDNAVAQALFDYPLNTPLLIKADKRVSHGEVVRLMDIASQVGFEKISIASIEKQ